MVPLVDKEESPRHSSSFFFLLCQSRLSETVSPAFAKPAADLWCSPCGREKSRRRPTMATVTTVALLSAAWVIIAAQPPCDPLTQYIDSGRCCQMCDPGTRMSNLGTCSTPQCLPCDDNEYQDTYTTEDKCQRQPYCDPNKNFQIGEQRSKTEKSTCLCKQGFHCSSDVCLTCVPHRPCEPGWGVVVKGNQTHDTVCHKCPEGTFSNQSSWDSSCMTWTKCEGAYVVGRRGSDSSDVVCEKNQRRHVFIACGVLAVIVILLLAAIKKIWFSRGKEADSKGKACVPCDKEPTREVFFASPHGVDEEAACPAARVSLEDTGSGGSGMPEENEDSPGQAAVGDLLFSERGNYVTQENGKAEVLSRQESQSMTVNNEMSW
ncbi:tumor necrosis factor receptor superfamily member 5 [Syngnathoides biaculeatus]|uniref:tumor necrosis factor receptor superfamily member 5 n=1 Tax=Syngnathoides biaculeatus TaxID=300417 RepID=UPI002ADD710E|nr:tumor necrosis factor receptor superfamily member 5 [Syngnathoides biaculeatus]